MLVEESHQSVKFYGVDFASLDKERVDDEFLEIGLVEESVKIGVHYSECSIMVQITIRIPLMDHADNLIGPIEVIGFFFLGKN